jgi:competence protein ComEC
MKRLAPLHIILGAFVLGLCSALGWRPGTCGVTVPLVVACVLAAVCWCWSGRSWRRVVCAAALALVAGVAGLTVGGLRVAAVAHSDLRPLIGTGGQVDAVLLDLPEAGPRGVSVPVAVTAVEGRSVRGRALLQISVQGPVPPELTNPCGPYTEGAVLRLANARLRPLPQAPAAGFNYGRYLARRGIHVVLSVSAQAAKPTGFRGGPLGLLDRLRVRARGTLQRGLPSPQRDVLRGMLLGDDENVDARAIEDFRRSGLLHIMAVSGENVVLLCSLVGAALGALRLSRRTTLCLLLPVIAAYVLLTGCAPSIVRAGVAGAVVTLAGLVSRPTDRLLLVLAPAVVLLSLNPWNLLDAGFQLSFAAVIGLFLLGGRFRALLGKMPRPVAEPAAVTMAASIATAPVSLAAFGQASLVGVVANVAGGFVLGPVMLLGMLSVLVGLVLPPLSTVLNVLAGLLIAFLLEVAHVCARLPLAVYQWRGPTLPLLLAAAGLAMLLVLQHLAARAGVGVAGFAFARRRRPLIGLAAATLAAVSLALAPCGGRAPGAPTLTILDVGEGAAALVQAPHAPTVLVDAGPGPLAGSLRKHGVARIDLLVLSHGHADHTGGVTDVLRSLKVDRALLPRPPTADPSLDRLQKELENAGTRVSRCTVPLHLTCRGYELQVLPTHGGHGGSNQDENDWALVVAVTLRAQRVLLPGDVEGAALDEVVEGPFAVVEVPHHGSSGGLTDSMLADCASQLAVISVGTNSYGHPTGEALAQLRAFGVPCLRTDRDGEVVLSVSGDGDVLCATQRLR